MIKILPKKSSFIEFSKEAKIPVIGQIPLEGICPFSVYEELSLDLTYSSIFNSGKVGDKSFKFTYINLDYKSLFSAKGDHYEITSGNKKVTNNGDPLKALQKFLNVKNESKSFSYAPDFFGGFIGFIGYDAVRFFEDIPNTTKDDLDIPDIAFIKTEKLIAIDHHKKLLNVIILTEQYEKAVNEIIQIIQKIKEIKPKGQGKKKHTKIKLNIDKNMPRFINMVKRAKKYIEEGDIYQANISHRMDVKFKDDPFSLYKRLYEINPSPFACFFKMKDAYIVSSSPERLIKVSGNKIETRPIAGTRPRGKNIAEDNGLSKELILNEKERAEHLMLVDLERNDVSKVSEFESVKVDEFMVLEKYSHVWHIVSNVIGRLRADVNCIDIIKACFPGGTITGCPKVRCMEIIDELEKTNRAFYTGSFGYIGLNGDLDLNILIRTILVKEQKAYFSVGAGIVADSDPEKEYKETISKAKAMLLALDC